MNLEYSVSDIEKCTVEKVAVVFKGEAGWLNQLEWATRAPGEGRPSRLMRRESISILIQLQLKKLMRLPNCQSCPH